MQIEDDRLVAPNGWTVVALLPVHDHYVIERYVILAEDPKGGYFVTAIYDPKNPEEFTSPHYIPDRMRAVLNLHDRARDRSGFDRFDSVDSSSSLSYLY